MTRACHTAVRMATGDAFSDEDIEAFLTRLAAKARRARAAEPTLDERAAISQAATALTKEQLKEALIARRLVMAAGEAREARQARLAAMPKAMTGAQRLEALTVGSERQGFGTSASVDATGRALQMTLWARVERGLSEMPGLTDRLANFWGVGDKTFARQVAREMARLTGGEGLEPTGDAAALHAARVFVAALEDGRSLQNDAGAFIDRLPGYVAKQSHDAGKIAGGYWRELGQLAERARASGAAGALDWTGARLAAERKSFADWRDFIRPLLDEDRTFKDLEAGDVYTPEEAKALGAAGILKDPADVAEQMLHRIWQDIATGVHEKISGMGDEGDFRPDIAAPWDALSAPSMARAVSRARVLHFSSPDAWMDYADRYGRQGNLFGAIMAQLERAGRNAALMRMFGPAPETAWTNEVQRAFDAARTAGDVGAQKGIMQGGKPHPMLQARFDAVNGMADAPVNFRLAQFMNGVRQWEALTKLGSIVLSKTTDLPITAGVFKRAGASWLAGYRAAFVDGILHLGDADRRSAADALDVGARSFAGHIGGQYLANDLPKGWLGWGVKTLYRINGFEALNNSIRHGSASAYSAFLGGETSKGWGELSIGARETFERFGVAPADWEKARALMSPTEDGRTFFTLDALEGDPELRLKFATMVHNLLDDTVSEPRARERSGMTRGSRAGTVLGELDRSFFQFKGFINAIVGRHLVPAARGYAGASPVSLLAHLILGTTLAGYVSMNAKAISRGELPRSPIGPDAGKTWLAALAQGGGLGLYGDFLFGAADRQGRDFDLASLGGPMLSDGEQVAKLVRQAVSGGAVNSMGQSEIPGELVHLGSQQIPLINLWYTRLALDYLLLWRLQEAARPGYLQRNEARVRNQEHGDFWLHPTSVTQ